MSAGLVTVKMELNGQPFSNTFGIMLGDDSVPLTEADLVAMVDEATVGADQTPAASPKVVNAIVDYLMLMVFPQVQLTNVYVTDGRNTAEGGDPTTIFFSKNLGIHGNRVPPNNEEEIAPGNVALMISRVPAGFSSRQGRLELRGALVDGQVSYKGPGLVGWGTGSQAQLTGIHTGALTDSGLVNHFSGGSAAAGGIIGIPHYQPELKDVEVQPFDVGNLIGMTPIRNLTVVRPISRQVKRGRKER